MAEKSAEGSKLSMMTRTNPWMVSTFVLGILFLIALFVATTGSGSLTGSVLTEEQIGQKVLGVANAQGLQEVTISSVEKLEDSYVVSVNVGGQVVLLTLSLDGKYILQPLAGSPSNANTNPNPAPSNEPVVLDEAQLKNAPFKGQANAPVTLVVFSDFECPFCERFYSDAYKQVNEQYVTSGKVKIVFMQFPLSFHPEAQKAAEASLCVQAQKGNEGFWKMHDKLFDNQADLSVENYKKWARELGVDGPRFDRCLDNGEFEARVNAELAYGQSLGVSGTPSSFVNGVPLVGAQPFNAFKQVIDAQLAA